MDNSEKLKQEIEVERSKVIRKKLGKCSGCRFCNFNTNIGKSYQYDYCNVRDEMMDNSLLGDYFSIAFCKHFKKVEGK